ncbi:ABC-type nitrate/sulfonate/bicarbonate transport system substrate-binding protein [Silvimonas terrae]|uniref:ABC-type nitrate/sulfonate/bicarbonate transport system substrate-binding protein n=1 Tax=Silvimonas terrae TaxID=300266 RepID=A0A840RBN7_9NEIS|nr:ABC transporter substrate-binding protein [Silvimonas terrae]MBB5190765.1 ABC-type nitrate/sulfonate/bicarbonate transport system substrate-binding protein [Silvimonas terrae]
MTQTIWYTRCPVPTPLGIAARQGWFDQEFAADGIAIRSLQDANVSAAQRRSHIDHDLPHSWRQGGSIPALWARSMGADTRVLGFSWVDESQLIITRHDSGISGLAGLRGRRIGLPLREGQGIDIFRAMALRGFVSALSLAGLTLADVEVVLVPVPETPDIAINPEQGGARQPSALRSRRLYAAETGALLRGEVDAIYAKGSLGLELAYIVGARVLVDIGFHPDPHIRVNNGSPRPITLDAAALTQHPDQVRRFLRRIVEVGDWAQQHPDATVDWLAGETASAPDWVRLAYGPRVHEGLSTTLDDDTIAAFDEFKHFLLQHGFLPADFSVRDWIDPAPLADVLDQRQAA